MTRERFMELTNLWVSQDYFNIAILPQLDLTGADEEAVAEDYYLQCVFNNETQNCITHDIHRLKNELDSLRHENAKLSRSLGIALTGRHPATVSL